MTRPAAIRAQYVKWQHLTSQNCIRISFDIDVAFEKDAYQVLGGMPQPNQWFVIAALNEQGKASDTQVIPGEVDISTGESSSQPRQVIATAKPTRRSWDELTPTEQAGIRCNDIKFQKFIRELYPEDVGSSLYTAVSIRDMVRKYCGVNSRKELATNAYAHNRWLALENHYQTWLAKGALNPDPAQAQVSC